MTEAVRAQLALLPEYLAAHIQLTLAALTVALALSLPLGIWATRQRVVEAPVLALASAVQTIPSLALLAIMVPLLASVGASGIGFLPAFIALSLYGMLPILRNVVTGIRHIDRAIVEAADGVGMTSRQRLLWVELPLATPIIVAGIRTATVWIVGMATLSTPVGAPSLGNYIFTGLQTRNYTALTVGCIAAAVLALTMDGSIRWLERSIRLGRRSITWLIVAVYVALGAWSLGQGTTQRTDERELVIGAKAFTEQYILAEILAEHVTRTTTMPSRTLSSLGSTVAYDALRKGEIDVYVDYGGTLWANVMRRNDVAPRDEVLRRLRQWLPEQHGVHVVARLGFENAYMLATSPAVGDRLPSKTITALATIAPRLTLAADYEFFGRPEWAQLQSAYALEFGARRTMDPSLLYEAAGTDQVDVIAAYSTDGRISARRLVPLEDDRQAFLPYDALILVSDRLFREHPTVVSALSQLEGSIDDDLMRGMNERVDVRKQPAATVAAAFIGSLHATQQP